MSWLSDEDGERNDKTVGANLAIAPHFFLLKSMLKCKGRQLLNFTAF